MNRDKQIEEMNEIIRKFFGSSFAYKIDYGKYGGYEGHKEVYTKDIAIALTAKGCRKSSDVAREIFEEIGKPIHKWGKLAEQDNSDYGELAELILSDIVASIAELKKKYTESEKDSDEV